MLSNLLFSIGHTSLPLAFSVEMYLYLKRSWEANPLDVTGSSRTFFSLCTSLNVKHIEKCFKQKLLMSSWL
jgi:hypothetical protein